MEALALWLGLGGLSLISPPYLDGLLSSAVKTDNPSEVQGPIKQSFQIKTTRTSSSNPTTPRSSRVPPKEERVTPKEDSTKKEINETPKKEVNETPKKDDLKDSHKKHDESHTAAVSTPVIVNPQKEEEGEVNYERLYKDAQTQVSNLGPLLNSHLI